MSDQVTPESDYTCPTLCDDDCDALCHEGHQVSAKRRHDVDECEALQGGWTVIPPGTGEVS